MPWMFKPLNSLIGYGQLLFQGFQGMIFMCVIIDVWDTSNYLPLGWSISGFVVNLFCLGFTSLFRKGLVSFAEIMDLVNPDKNFTLEYQSKLWCKIHRLAKFIFEQPHFFNNTVFYLILCIFLGSWIGLTGGNISYQPLPNVPSAAAISGYVIQKCFAILLVAMAGFNLRLMFDSNKTIATEGMYFTKRLECKVDQMAKGASSHSQNMTETEQHSDYRTSGQVGSKFVHYSKGLMNPGFG